MRLACCLWALVAFEAAAAKRLVVMGTGDCRDGELMLQVRQLSDALSARLGAGAVMDEQDVRRRLGLTSSRGVDDLERQIETGRRKYLEAQYGEAEQILQDAIAEIERLPVPDDYARLRVAAEEVRALNMRSNPATRNTSLGDDAFRVVLSLMPDYQPNIDYYSPSTRRRFEELRQEVKRAKKVPLVVKSTPPGATVFVDGAKVGVTPYSGTHLPGPRRVMLVTKGGATSLPRVVDVRDEGASVVVDLEFEAAIHPDRKPCVASGDDEKARLSSAVKFGALLGVSEVVVLRLDRQRVGPSWLEASLVQVHGAQKIRTGGLKVNDTGSPLEGIDELAAFTVTGEPTARVLTAPPQLDAAPVPTALAPQPGALPASSGWMRPGAYASGGVAAAALVLGAVFQLQALGSWGEYESYYANGRVPTAEEAAAVNQIESRAGQQQLLAVGGFGLAALAGAASAVLWWKSSGDSEGPTVQPSGDGVVASGRFSWP